MIKFPLEFDGYGGLKQVDASYAITQAIKQALMIRQGEHILRPSFGLAADVEFKAHDYWQLLNTIKGSLDKIKLYYPDMGQYELKLTPKESGDWAVSVTYNNQIVEIAL